MKYVLTERQYRLLAESEGDNLFYIDPEAFDNRWDIIVKVLKKRGFPKWKTDKKILLTDEDIDSLYNLVEVGDLDITDTNITDLGVLRKVRKLAFDPYKIKDIGDLSEVYAFDTFSMFKKAVNLGFSGGTFGRELQKIRFSDFTSLIDIKSDIRIKVLKDIFDGEYSYEDFFSDSYYSSDDNIENIVDYYLSNDNLDKLKEALIKNEDYDETLSLVENIIESDSDIRYTLSDSYTSCLADDYYEYIIRVIESSLDKIVDVKNHGYDEYGLYFEAYFDYDKLFEYFEGYDYVDDMWFSGTDMFNIVLEMFANDLLVYDKPKFDYDSRFEPDASKKCLNDNFEERINEFL